ncbi:MAG: N-acetyltransferase [bacterium]|nr:N-acetyltransferase [bacterium]
MKRKAQPDFAGLFHEWYGGKPRKVEYEVRADSNRNHDLVFLNSFVHDARFKRSGITYRGTRLTIPIERDCWELGHVQSEGQSGLYVTSTRLSLSPVYDLEWHFDHERDCSPDSELSIMSIQLQVRTIDMRNVQIQGDGWGLTCVANDNPLKLRIQDLEVPYLPWTSRKGSRSLLINREREVILIRTETPEDIPAVRVVNERAFEQPAEANVVDKLRAACPDALSLVAENESGDVVGHILFTPATIACGDRTVEGMGLAPMSVLPELQNNGIGSELVRHGLDILAAESCPFVVVLGHPKYYPRFGFEPASCHGITCQWDGVPDEAFMVLIQDTEAMDGVTGAARYRDEFDEAM